MKIIRAILMHQMCILTLISLQWWSRPKKWKSTTFNFFKSSKELVLLSKAVHRHLYIKTWDVVWLPMKNNPPDYEVFVSDLLYHCQLHHISIIVTMINYGPIRLFEANKILDLHCMLLHCQFWIFDLHVHLFHNFIAI